MGTKPTELSIEEVLALYQSDKVILNPTYKLWRLDGGESRFYYTIDADGEPVFFTSWTSIISTNLPKNPYLIKWMMEMGEEGAKAYMEERASYGTFMHIQIERFLVEKVYDFDLLFDKLEDWEYKSGHKATKWYWEMRKDLLSFMQFSFDVNLEPIAIEIALASETMGAAGSLDLVCNMDITENGPTGEFLKSGPNKGEEKIGKIKKRVKAIVDFKSGKKGFFDGHIIQLEGYRRTWNENFPMYPITRTFNWAPSEWKGDSATYKLEEQTDKWQRLLVDPLVMANKIRVENDNVKPRDILKIKGKVEFGTEIGNDVLQKINIINYIKERSKK